MRDNKKGWMQGFITLTTFTTWAADFEWESVSVECGIPAARLLNARLRKGEPPGHDPTIHVANSEETPQSIAADLSMSVNDLVRAPLEIKP